MSSRSTVVAKSFVGLAGVAEFGASTSAVIGKLGRPNTERTQQSSGLVELRYPSIGLILRFGDQGLCEITIARGCNASLNGVEILWAPDFLLRVLGLGHDLQDTGHGTLYSGELGMMLTGFHDEDESGMAVHLILRGAWETFRFESKTFDLQKWARARQAS